MASEIRERELYIASKRVAVSRCISSPEMPISQNGRINYAPLNSTVTALNQEHIVQLLDGIEVFDEVDDDSLDVALPMDLGADDIMEWEEREVEDRGYEAAGEEDEIEDDADEIDEADNQEGGRIFDIINNLI